MLLPSALEINKWSTSLAFFVKFEIEHNQDA